jgi:hypothetical protein
VGAGKVQIRRKIMEKEERWDRAGRKEGEARGIDWVLCCCCGGGIGRRMFFSSLPIAGIRCCLVPPSFPFPVNQKMPMPKKLSSIFKLLGLLLPVLLFLLNIAGEENARNFVKHSNVQLSFCSPHQFASTLIQMQGSLEVFRDLIAKRPTWREIQIHYWHKVDGPVLQKFIIGSKNIRDQLSPEHPLSNFLDDIVALRR